MIGLLYQKIKKGQLFYGCPALLGLSRHKTTIVPAPRETLKKETAGVNLRGSIGYYCLPAFAVSAKTFLLFTNGLRLINPSTGNGYDARIAYRFRHSAF